MANHVMEAARAAMVDSQVRPNQVSDARVVAAMRVLPREEFAPAGSLGYGDADIALGDGRYLPAPMLIAKLTQLVMAQTPEHVLVVGAGSGYGAAILSLCGAQVVALEEDAKLRNAALAKSAPNVEQAFGPLDRGWPAAGPYDAILIEGAVTAIPEIFAGQLAPHGKIVAVVADTGAQTSLCSVVLAEPVGQGFAQVKMFDCAARLLPAFRPAPVFSF